jgi:hypothetical protein
MAFRKIHRRLNQGWSDFNDAEQAGELRSELGENYDGLRRR